MSEKMITTRERHIRPTRPEDWEAIQPLLQQMGSRSDEAVSQRFARIVRSDDHFLQVAVDDGLLIGYTWAQDYGPHLRSGDRTARLYDLFVVPAHRRQGIGAALFMAVKAWAQQRRVRYLQWHASQAAVPFYEGLGYTGDPCPQPEYPFFEIDFTVNHQDTH